MQDQPDLRARLEKALAEGQRLREEVGQLKAILAQHSTRKRRVMPFEECLRLDDDHVRRAN